jgi:type I restriction enzyme M protein
MNFGSLTVGSSKSQTGTLTASSPISVCLWFLTKSKKNKKHGDHHGKTLFIDARRLGALVDRVHRELTAAEIARSRNIPCMAGGDSDSYRDIRFCKSATLDEIKVHGFVLTSGRHVGSERRNKS